jgi:hypothetical protein
VAGAVLVVLGFIGFAFSQNKNGATQAILIANNSQRCKKTPSPICSFPACVLVEIERSD